MEENLLCNAVTHYGAVVDDHKIEDERHGLFIRQKIYLYQGVFYIHTMYNGETILFEELQRA